MERTKISVRSIYPPFIKEKMTTTVEIAIAIFVLLALLGIVIGIRRARLTGDKQNFAYLTAQQVIEINEAVTESRGLLRDLNGLEGAIVRPRTVAYYEQADLATQTSVLIEGIAMAHPFIDGNKRTAMVAGIDFLLVNGYTLKAQTANDIGPRIERLVVERNTTEFTSWLRASIQRR